MKLLSILTVAFLIILLVSPAILKFFTQPSSELFLESTFMQQYESLSSENQQQQQSEQGSYHSEVPQEEQAGSQTMYRWKDEKGHWQFTEKAPENRDYKEIVYHSSKLDKQPPRSYQPPENYQPPRFNPITASSQRHKAVEDEHNISLPVRCEGKLSRLHRFEKKLDDSATIAESIWLHDYCSALSEFIQEGCVIPKKQVKYNAYCPLRFR